MFDESPAEAWLLRYGESPPGLPDLGRFLNHRSVRKYDTSRDVPESLVAGLVSCAQSAATSSNLQLWSLVSVQSPEKREQVALLCGDQSQVRGAAWFFAFVADHARLRSIGQAAGETCAGLDYNEFYTMAVIDVALAAERMVCAAEALGLATCYIGGLRNDVAGVKALLGLPCGTVPLFGLCLGWPVAADSSAIKPRLPQASVWFRETYDLQAGTGDYDDRMRKFYESQGMNGDVTWAMRSVRRVDGEHMTGRERLKPFLTEQGLDKR